MIQIDRVEVEIHLTNGSKIPITLDGEFIRTSDDQIAATMRNVVARELLRLSTLSALPMHRPPPGPIENANVLIDEFIEDGLAELRGDVVHRTAAGDQALRDAGFTE